MKGLGKSRQPIGHGAWIGSGGMAAGAMLFLAGGGHAQMTGDGATVTFARDVAPILQASCQECHNPAGIAPMALTTYDEVRPWAPMIREKVTTREMPPWHVDKNFGIQEFKNDISLTDDEIRTIVQWADSGAPMGDPADLPPPLELPDGRDWRLEAILGRPPDIIVRTDPFTVPDLGPDQWPQPVVDIPGLDGPRWVMANETKPAYPMGRKVVHHANSAVERVVDGEQMSYGLSNFGVGKPFDIYPPDTGMLIQPGDKVSWNLHYYPVGEVVENDVIELGIWLYPEDETPRIATAGDENFSSLRDDQEIVMAPNSRQVTQGIHVLQKPARIHSFRVHQHLIGTGQSLEAVYPDGRVEILGKAGWHPAWHITYLYEDHVAPILPKGTVLIVTSWYDNTEHNRWNPDFNTWRVFGRRTGDEMSHMWVGISYLDDQQYEYLVAERERVLEERRSKAENVGG